MTDSDLAILGGRPVVDAELHRTWPEITQADRDAVMAVLDRGILTGTGAVAAPGLAADYARYVGVEHCLPLNSGTAALHACAAAVGVQPGDEVIVPAFTYIASAMALGHQGARPVFCDVTWDTFNLDPVQIERHLTERTRAIMVVHLHGMPADLDEIMAVAERHGLAVIEDVAQAHGARYKGRMVGTFGRCAGASLNVTKNLSGGEGGLFVTDDLECLRVARRLRYMGEDLPDAEPPTGRRYWSHGLGWNYRLQELPAAFARSQLERLDDYNAHAQAMTDLLSRGLADICGVIPPARPEDRESIWYLYRVRLDREALGWEGPACELRDRVILALQAEGVHASIWQHLPIPAHPVFRRRGALSAWQPSQDPEPLALWDPAAFPVASRLCDESFVLGSGNTPWAVQTAALAEQYVAALRKVLARIDDVAEMPFDVPPETAASTAVLAGR